MGLLNTSDTVVFPSVLKVLLLMGTGKKVWSIVSPWPALAVNPGKTILVPLGKGVSKSWSARPGAAALKVGLSLNRTTPARVVGVDAAIKMTARIANLRWRTIASFLRVTGSKMTVR
jgi:hypothetical protein